MCCADVSVVAADPSTGAVCADDVVSAIRPATVLVSLLLAQNETGYHIQLYWIDSFECAGRDACVRVRACVCVCMRACVYMHACVCVFVQVCCSQ